MSDSYRGVLGILLGVTLLSPFAAFAQGSSSPEERAVLNLEDQFLQSRVTGDTSAARTGFSSDAVFIHENGDERTKAAYLKEATHEAHWVGVEKTERIVHLYGDAAVTHAVIVIKVGLEQTATVRTRTTGVYAKEAGKWRIVSWQSTPLADSHYAPSKP